MTMTNTAYKLLWVITPDDESYKPVVFGSYANMVEYLFKNEKTVCKESFKVSHAFTVDLGDDHE